MSKEEEARQQQSSNPQHPTAYSNPAYNGSTPHVQSAAQPGQMYNALGAPNVMTPPPVAEPSYLPVAGPVEAKKSVVEAYLLWLVLGLVGAHHFYLKRPVFGVLYFFTFGLLGCGYVIDMFRMPYLVIQANKRTEDPKEQNKKNISDAYTLWFPFGLLGFHHFYLNSPGFGLLYFFTFGLLGIGWLIDLVRIPYLVKEANKDVGNTPEKSKCTAYAFGLTPAGILGAHHFYLNRPIFGMIWFLTFGNLGVGWIVDWFRIHVLVKRANREIRHGQDYKRYLDDAYLLWFPLGLIGMHHFYLNRPVWGFIYFLTFGMLGVGWLIDGFRMPCLVSDCNKLTEERMKIPTAFTVSPSGYGLPTTPAGYGTAAYNGYNAQLHYTPAGVPIGSNPQPYQYPPQQRVPSYMEQPPPYSPPKTTSIPPQQPPPADDPPTKSPM